MDDRQDSHRRRHDLQAAINSLKMLAEIFEANVELTAEEKTDIAKKLRESHKVLQNEFENLFTNLGGKT